MRTKSKNKAIKGRRNRCHAVPPFFVIRCQQMDKETTEKFLRDLEACQSRRTPFVINDPYNNIEVVNPNTFKRPRFAP